MWTFTQAINTLLCHNLGIDLADAAQMGEKLNENEDVARRCKVIHDNIKLYQDAMTSLEKVILLIM
jgi:O-acetyl-ADP-ribose deacetylase (regulator of RNase III)